MSILLRVFVTTVYSMHCTFTRCKQTVWLICMKRPTVYRKKCRALTRKARISRPHLSSVRVENENNLSTVLTNLSKSWWCLPCRRNIYSAKILVSDSWLWKDAFRWTVYVQKRFLKQNGKLKHIYAASCDCT